MNYVRPAVRANALRLHFNENTAGCSPAVAEALRSLTREDAAWYPDYAAMTARTARSFGIPAEWVQLTNGLDEGLMAAAQHAARHALRDGTGARAHALVVEPAFEMYAACADAVGLGLVRIESGSDFVFPLDRVCAAVGPDTRVIYLTDPNNPTGLAIPPDALETIAAAAPHAIVVLDEAYADFSGRTAIGPLLDRLRNVVVGRTFAKAHGLAALRIGALVAHPALMDRLRPLFPPYSVNVAAIRALDAALDDRAYLDAYVAATRESRERIYGFCKRHGFTHWPSDANFVLVRIGANAASIVAAMADRGVMVRDKSAAPGCAGCVRITAGVVAHTDQALAALEDVLASRTR
jgi:histidinol-phosphate aminotransferase